MPVFVIWQPENVATPEAAFFGFAAQLPSVAPEVPVPALIAIVTELLFVVTVFPYVS